MIFDTMIEVRNHLFGEYPKSKGKTLVGWTVSDTAILIGVYEGEDMVQGLSIYHDINREKWIILDNFHADLAVRSYAQFREEFDDAIALFELIESELDEDEEDFFSTLD